MFFRLLILFLLVYLMVKLVQSFFQPKVHQSSNNTYRNTTFNSQRKEGETFIENLNSKKTKKIPRNEGDYIDYEDV